jgi:hypothetical protein
MANQFWEFCENACIELKYVSVAQPRANGQVERANGMIIEGLKKGLYDENSKKGGKWIHEFPLSSGGSGLSHPKPRDKHRSFLSTAPKQSYRLTSCGNPQGLNCTMKPRRMKQGS